MSEKDRKEDEQLLKYVPEEDKGDIVMLRLVLKNVTEFLKEVKEPISDLIKTLGTGLDGEKIGEDVSKFYQNLKAAGVPEELAEKMTLEYFNKRLEAAQAFSGIVKSLMEGIRTRHGQESSKEEKMEKFVSLIESLKQLKNKPEEKEEK